MRTPETSHTAHTTSEEESSNAMDRFSIPSTTRPLPKLLLSFCHATGAEIYMRFIHAQQHMQTFQPACGVFALGGRSLTNFCVQLLITYLVFILSTGSGRYIGPDGHRPTHFQALFVHLRTHVRKSCFLVLWKPSFVSERSGWICLLPIKLGFLTVHSHIWYTFWISMIPGVTWYVILSH